MAFGMRRFGTPAFTGRGPTMPKTISFEEISLAEHERRVATQARQLFRAVDADDTKAIAASIFQFKCTLESTLPLYLNQDPRWQPGAYFLDALGRMPIEVRPPTWLRVRDTMSVMAESREGKAPVPKYDCLLDRPYEPFEFEMELCAETGAMNSCSYRFGDKRRFTDPAIDADGVPHSGDLWAFSIAREFTQCDGRSARGHTGGSLQLTWDGKILTPPFETYPDEPKADEEEDWSENTSMSSFTELIAVYVRQLFRAHAAADPEAVEWSLQCHQHFLIAAVAYQLRKEPRWGWDTLNPHKQLWHYLEETLLEILPPNTLIASGGLTWSDRDGSYLEPFEYEVNVSPSTGAFRSYRFRFGDDRPLAEKGLTSRVLGELQFPQDGGWEFSLRWGGPSW